MAAGEYLSLFIRIFFDLLSFAILVRVLLSWMDARGGGGPVVKLKMVLYDVTEPVLSFFRKVVPRAGMIDFSPLVALLALDLVKVLLLSVISS